jgi:hypothetical protein
MIVRITASIARPPFHPAVVSNFARQNGTLRTNHPRWSPSQLKSSGTTDGLPLGHAKRVRKVSTLFGSVPQPALALAYDYVDFDEDENHPESPMSNLGGPKGTTKRTSGSIMYPPLPPSPASKKAGGGGGSGGGRHRCPKVRCSVRRQCLLCIPSNANSVYSVGPSSAALMSLFGMEILQKTHFIVPHAQDGLLSAPATVLLLSTSTLTAFWKRSGDSQKTRKCSCSISRTNPKCLPREHRV